MYSRVKSKKFYGISQVFGGTGAGPVLALTFQGSISGQDAVNSPNTFAAMPIGAAFATRTVVAIIICGGSYNGAPSAVTIGGITATTQSYLGTGAATNSFSSIITFAWANVTSGTTANVVMTGGASAGDSHLFCLTYTFDQSLALNGSPTSNSHNVTATTSNTVTLNTGANGFIIAVLAAEFLGSETGMSITASTETYTQDLISTGDHRLVSSKKSGSAASSPTSVTFGWTGSVQALAALLAWN